MPLPDDGPCRDEIYKALIRLFAIVFLIVVSFIIPEKARAKGEQVRKCRCYERQRAAA